MKKFILLTLIFVLAACSAGGSELERNQQRWQGTNVSHYRFDLSIGCFCAFRSQMPLKVEVVDGQIVSMVDVNGAIVLDTDPNYAFFMEYATVEGLFAAVQKAVDENADTITATYDSTYGFPVDVQIDYSQQMADEELYLNAANFEALP
jgi:hypothetical protein